MTIERDPTVPTTPNKYDPMESFLESAAGDRNYSVTNSVGRALDALRSAKTDTDLAIKVIDAIDHLERALATLRQRPERYR